MATTIIVAGAARGSVGSRPEPPPTPFAINELEESIIVTIDDPVVGSAAVLSLTGVRPAASGPLTRISTIHSVGLVAYRAEQWAVVVDGRAELTVPTGPMREAGQHRFTVFTDAQFGELSVRVDPGPPTPGLVPIIGPSRVEADGASPVLVTVVAADEFGNPVADGTEVVIAVRRPNGSEEQYVGTTRNTVAGVKVPATTDVGVVSVVAIVGGVPSEPAEFSQVAGPPARATLSSDADQIVADGRSVVTVTADDVVDRNGNPVTDGTALRAVVDGPSGSSTVGAQVINGRAVFLVRSPSAPGNLEVTLTPRRFTSVAESDVDAESALTIDTGSSLTVRATSAVVSISAGMDGSDAVIVGPVLAPSGGFVSDGTVVHLLWNGRTVGQAQILNGYVRLPLPNGAVLSPEDSVAVEVLGLTHAVAR